MPSTSLEEDKRDIGLQEQCNGLKEWDSPSMGKWGIIITSVLVLLDVAKAQQEPVNITILEDLVSQGAVCLDGSPPAYYLRRGSSPNWHVFMEGGGWCYGDGEERSCATRSNTSIGSSTLMSKERSLDFGIFNNSVETNPDFWNWNHVWINYCDGGNYFGDVDEPVPVVVANQTRLLYYRGFRIWKSIMKDLLAKGMKDANMALLTGCSAGGIASAMLCNDFKELLPNASIVKCVSDGGFLLDLKDLTGNRSLRAIAKAMVKEHHIVVGLERNYVPKNAAYQQLFPQYFLPSIQPPFFWMNAAYDTWQIRNTLQYPTAEWRPCVDNPASCNHTQLAILQGFRKHFLKNLEFAYQREDWGMFINSCFHHCQGAVANVTVYNQTIVQAVGDWYFDRKPTKDVDHLPWPSNPTCTTYYEDTWL